MCVVCVLSTFRFDKSMCVVCVSVCISLFLTKKEQFYSISFKTYSIYD